MDFKLNNSPLSYLNGHETVFKFYGVFDVNPNSEFMGSLFKFYRKFHQVFFVYFGVTIQIMAVVNSNSIAEAIQIFFIGFAYLNASVKTYVVHSNRKRLQELWVRLNDTDYQVKDNNEQRLLDVSKYHIKSVINIYSWFGTINMFVLVLTPVFEWTRRLPFNTWLPFDVNNENNIVFGSIYLYQIGCAIYAGGSNIMVNMYVFAVMVCLNFCLALFSSRIKRFGYESGLEEYYTELPKKRVSYYNEVIGYVNLHLKIDELVEEIQMVFNGLFFVQVIQSALVFANSAFLLIAVDQSKKDLMVPAFWLSAFLAEMAIYCYFGNNIIYTFDGISTSVYCSKFIAFDRKTSQALLLIMTLTGTRRMSIIGTGLVKFEMSLQTLLKILKTTYSIIMLIRSM